MRAWLFSGQVSEFPGMGRDFWESSPEARDLFEETSAIAGFDLAESLFSADENAIHENRVAQTGVFLVSTLAARELMARGERPGAIAGYSLGNYAALVAAGAVSYSEALTILLAVLSESDRLGISGAMGAVIGMSESDVEACCARQRDEGRPVWIGNVNAATQLVVTGSVSGVDALLAEVSPRALRALRLPMSWPIHSVMMDVVARAVVAVVAGCRTIVAPRVPVYAGHSFSRLTTRHEIEDLLVRQVALPSRWKDTVEAMFADGNREFLEVGPGETLTRMLRWIVREARCSPAGTLAAIAALPPEQSARHSRSDHE